ncbi:MAG TPA: hypothetical protein VG518_06740, partial [Solirubrobacterales bacterium]|nr:hypothetical protein [Solirubrobacterales bacterium]
GLLLRAPRSVDYPPPFQLAPNASTVSLDITGTGPRDVTVAFYAQAVRPGPGSLERHKTAHQQ